MPIGPKSAATNRSCVCGIWIPPLRIEWIVLHSSSTRVGISEQYRHIPHRRIWTSPAPFLYNQRSCCYDDTDPVRKARVLPATSWVKNEAKSCNLPTESSKFRTEGITADARNFNAAYKFSQHEFFFGPKF